MGVPRVIAAGTAMGNIWKCDSALPWSGAAGPTCSRVRQTMGRKQGGREKRREEGAADPFCQRYGNAPVGSSTTNTMLFLMP